MRNIINIVLMGEKKKKKNWKWVKKCPGVFAGDYDSCDSILIFRFLFNIFPSLLRFPNRTFPESFVFHYFDFSMFIFIFFFYIFSYRWNRDAASDLILLRGIYMQECRSAENLIWPLGGICAVQRSTILMDFNPWIRNISVRRSIYRIKRTEDRGEYAQYF